MSLLLLAGDIAVNLRPNSTLNGIQSRDGEPSSMYNCQNLNNNNEDKEIFSSYYDLGLGDHGLRMGHWNVNYLTLSKFEQIKPCLLDDSRKPQIDVFF